MPQPKQDKHGYWYGDIQHKKKRIRKSFGKGVEGKRLAEHWCAQMTLERNNKKMGLIEDIPAEQFFVQYLEYAKANKAERSYHRDLTIIRHFLPVIKDKNISEIRAKDIERYKTFRLQTVKKTTVNRELNTILAAFTKAVEWGYLAKHPLKAVKKFKEVKKHSRFFSKDELQKILVAIEDNTLYVAIFLLLQTGMRRDELVHLEWRDISLVEGKLYIQPKFDWHPKDYEARTIPLNEQTKELLQSLPQNGKLVFDDGTGSFFLFPSSLSRSFKRILKNIGINESEASLHTLRHTYASHLVMAGVDLSTVKKLLGHSRSTTTERYAHLAPEHLKEAAEKLENRFCHFSDIARAKMGKTGQVINLKNYKKTNK